MITAFKENPDQWWANFLCGGPHMILNCVLRAGHPVCMIGLDIQSRICIVIDIYS